MSDKDDTYATPCWYTNGVWHDADGKPVHKKENIPSIISLESNYISYDGNILEGPTI